MGMNNYFSVFLLKSKAFIQRLCMGMLYFQTHENTTIIKLKQPWHLVACLAATIWYIFSPSPSTSSLAIVLNGLWIISYIWVRHIANHIYAERELKYTAFQVHDELEEIITLHNSGFLPVIWAELHDCSTLPDHDITSVRASTANNNINWTAKTICKQRGVFQLGPLKTTMSDPIGIFSVEQTSSQIEEIVIYPQLANLPENILPDTISIGNQQKLRQALPAETINAFTTRPYIPGDPLRRIHWQRTARENQPFVKIFEPESSGNIWLIPDFNASVQVGHGAESSSEFLATLLASLSNRLLRENMSVGMFSWTNKQTIVIPRLGRPHHWNILKAIAPLQPNHERPFSQVIRTALTLTSSRDLIIAITPSLDATWAKSPIQRNLMAILLDPEPFSGKQGVDSTAYHLRAKGIPTRILHRDEIKPIQAAYGPLSRWEFLVLSSGKVIVQQRPHQTPQQEHWRSPQ